MACALDNVPDRSAGNNAEILLNIWAFEWNIPEAGHKKHASTWTKSLLTVSGSILAKPSTVFDQLLLPSYAVELSFQ